MKYLFDKINGYATMTSEKAIALASATSSTVAEQAGNLQKVLGDTAKYMGDLNGDGKIDLEDFKIAMEKAGYLWDKLDDDAKKSIAAGILAYAGSSTIPVIGSALNGPSLVGVTLYTYVTLKCARVRQS